MIVILFVWELTAKHDLGKVQQNSFQVGDTK